MFSCSDPADAVSFARLAAASSQKVFCSRGEMPGCRDEEAHVLVRWSQSHCRSLHPRLCCEGPSHLAHARGIGACTLAVADVLARSPELGVQMTEPLTAEDVE